MDQHEAASGHGVAASVGEAASGAASSGASVTASASNVDMNVPEDFSHWEELRKTEIFHGLYRQVEKVVFKGKERQCLSHHTTRSCRKDRPPLESLKASGLENMIPSPSGVALPLVYVHVHLPHSFYDGDRWGFDYYSPPQCSMREPFRGSRAWKS